MNILSVLTGESGTMMMVPRAVCLREMRLLNGINQDSDAGCGTLYN